MYHTHVVSFVSVEKKEIFTDWVNVLFFGVKSKRKDKLNIFLWDSRSSEKWRGKVRRMFFWFHYENWHGACRAHVTDTAVARVNSSRVSERKREKRALKFGATFFFCPLF